MISAYIKLSCLVAGLIFSIVGMLYFDTSFFWVAIMLVICWEQSEFIEDRIKEARRN